ncbi:unnamed protein product [Brassica rapa subsp. narinosa]|uniref:(rape) hypothetical protein n=1 Tax=Brassica napus TaxID=3708 RepID=A0A816Z6U2_BRANA|nr:unnamed protein product [Brassica napus]
MVSKGLISSRAAAYGVPTTCYCDSHFKDNWKSLEILLLRSRGFSLVKFCYHERHQEEDSMQQEAWRIFERAKGTAVHHQKMRGHAHLLE